MTDRSEPDVAAAELALGLLDGEERAVALRRMLAEPKFAREVERWRGHFGGLFAGMPPVAADAALGEWVMARLDGPARAPARYWKPFAIASSLVAASLVAVVAVRPPPVAPARVTIAAPAPMVAAFMIQGLKTPLVASYDATAGRLSMPAPMAVPAGKSAQLWAIVGTDPAPHPLGLFHQAGARVEAEARSATPMPEGTTFAISIEPAGGSPTGAPTGPVVGSATLIRA